MENMDFDLKVLNNWYDKEGNKITLEEAENFLADDDYRILKQELVGEFFVSTIWLGLDHGILKKVSRQSLRMPVIFETIIFSNDYDGDRIEEYLKRYSTQEEALHGHEYAVFLAKEWNQKVKPKET